MASPTPKTIAIVLGSTRSTRVGPLIASHVEALAELHQTPNIQFELLDLAAQNLPLFDEPRIPAHAPPTNPAPFYAHAHTRAWSDRVQKYSAFIFVTPQYNWSIPAALKNAIDYLYHEWGGKPAGIVSYGNRGGGKAADHLRSVLGGMKVRVVETGAGLKVPLSEGVSDRVSGEWRESGEDERIGRMVEEIVRLLEAVESERKL